MPRIPSRLYVLAAALMCGIPAAHAELPAIRFDQIFPLGGASGSQFDVEIKGAELEGGVKLIFSQPGLTAEPIPEKERFFRVTIGGDVPTGTYEAYLSGRFGISNPRLLAVSRGLTEVADQAQNHKRETAQPVSLNVAVNGLFDGNAEDFYRFTAASGQRVLLDCQAQRLLTELDAVMTLTTADGQLIAASSDVYGQDPFLDFVAPADGDYIVEVHDLSYRGGAGYRLTIGTGPQVELVFPAAVQSGVPATLTAFGRNLQPLGGTTGEWLEGERPFDQLSFAFTADSSLLVQGAYRFRDHPTHYSTAPTAATCTLFGRQVEVPGVDAVWSFPPVLVTPDPVSLEAEANDVADSAQAVSLPLTLAGRFDKPRDADWFQFQPAESGGYLFDVYSERIAGRADPYLVIVDDKGNRVAELDDFGHRVNFFDGHLRDPSQEVNLNKDIVYRVLVQDRYLRGGARYHYVLQVRKAEFDFFPAVIHSSNPNTPGTTVLQGTASYFDVVIHHRGNTRQDITVTAENLPPGLHVATTTIPTDNRGVLVLWTDPDAPEWTGPISLTATANVDGREIRREVRSYSRIWNNSGTSLVQRSPMVAIRERGPYGLRLEPETIEVEAGQAADLTLQLARNWQDFRDKVTIQPMAFPGNFRLGNFDIAADQSSAPVKIEVQENTRPGRYTLTVLGQGQVPFNKDPKAADKPVTLVSTVSRPVTLVVKEKPKP